jgi:heptaprenyl diphosphate synthase
VLLAAAEASDRGVRAVAQHLIACGGKRVRPALLFAVTELGTVDEARVLDAAVVVELVHVASLYHDDVIDRAPLRRGARSANGRWGNSVATVAGTFLMARALEIAASLGDDVNRLVNEAVARLCTGQLQEIESAFDAELPEATHLEILEGKTATLFLLACRIAAHLAVLPPAQRTALGEYAGAVGVAFQIADDALDLVGETRNLGKQSGADLREGVYSLAVLRCAAAGARGARLRELLALDEPSDSDVRSILQLVRESGEIESALDTARVHARRAIDAASALPSGLVADSLINFARLAVNRSA